MELEEFPRDWDIEAEHHKTYEQLIDKNQTLSPFRGKDFADVFVYAMALGFHLKSHVPIKKGKSSVPFSVLSDRQWLIKSIAVAHSGGLEILLDKPAVAKIAEEYANGGIEFLKKIVYGEAPGEAYKKMETELRALMTSGERKD